MPSSTIAAPAKTAANLRKLVQQHRKLTHEPLLFAAEYKPEKPGKDIYLFEIVEGFGADSVDPSKTMFEVEYGSTSGFPMDAKQRLRLLLTSPTEFQKALEQNWKAVRILRKAQKSGNAEVLFQNARGARLWEALNG